MSIESKLTELIEELQKAKQSFEKSDEEELAKAAKKLKEKLPPPPAPEEHPPVLSEKDALKLVKEEKEELSLSANGQWSLTKAKIFDIKSKKMVADLGQPEKTTAPTGKLSIAKPGDKQPKPQDDHLAIAPPVKRFGPPTEHPRPPAPTSNPGVHTGQGPRHSGSKKVT